MHKFNCLIFILFVLLICGCAKQQPKQVTLINSFNKEEAVKLLEKGSSSITGSSLLRQSGGGVVTCAGNEVLLIPVTPYSTERIMSVYNNNDHAYNTADNFTEVNFLNDDQDYYKYGNKKSVCDAQGFFKFKDIKPGEYYIITKIIWQVGNQWQGGYIMKKVSVLPEENIEVVVN